jgi:pimeloyl-ACP methyl ester carboxylesterase
MRACQPDHSGFIERNGVHVGYEVFGNASPTLLLLPSWQIVHSRQWKSQVPYLARHYRVIAFDARGNGRSDRPTSPDAYAHREIVADAITVLDAVGVDQAVLIGTSLGGMYALEAAAWYPDRVLGVFSIGTAAPFLGSAAPGESPFYDLITAGSIAAYQEQAGLAGYPEFVEAFIRAAISEPHREKAIEDAIEFGLHTTPEVLDATLHAPGLASREDLEQICRQVRCPVRLIHGEQDAIIPYEHGIALAQLLGTGLVTIQDGGHSPSFADPIRCNQLIREFVESLTSVPRPQRWRRALTKPKSALFVSSPIGLGHTRRDLAIAHELRILHPDLEIDWLTQHPATQMLADHREQLHPAARFLASESAHIESEAGEHDLHAFQAYRRMDEILVNNFMVFHELLEQEQYDLVVADEGWDVDYFLHNNPHLKRSPFAWLTDFVGYLPISDGGPTEAALTANLNAEMIEQVARYPRLRDRSIFVGDPADLVDEPLGPGLPSVRSWTEENFSFAGYITDSRPPADREATRAQLDYRPDEQIVLVTVGGSGVGGHLLRKVIDAYPQVARQVPQLRMVVVAGPRIDPSTMTAPPGVQIRGYEPDLLTELTACDLAVVQGGLTTTMELVAAQRPFLYFPLMHHFEQQIHVPHRLDRYRAGRRMHYTDTTPDALVTAIVDELDAKVDYQPIATDGAHRAAVLLSDLL